MAGEVKKYEGIDPEAAREAATKLQELEDQKLIDANQIDELVAKRTERMRLDAETKYTALLEANQTLEARAANSETELHARMVENKIAAAVGGVGTVRKGAMEDILSRAKSVWRLDDDLNLVAMKGESAVYGTDGKTPLSPEEYATSLLQEAPYFFEGNSGSGAGGNDDDKGQGGNGTTIAAGDKTAFGANLEAIASGKVQVAS